MEKITPTPEFEAKFRARYEALYPQIDGRRSPGERTWLDRCSSWELFAGVFGAYAAENLRAVPEWRKEFPKLADLVLEAHPDNRT